MLVVACVSIFGFLDINAPKRVYVEMYHVRTQDKLYVNDVLTYFGLLIGEREKRMEKKKEQLNFILTCGMEMEI